VIFVLIVEIFKFTFILRDPLEMSLARHARAYEVQEAERTALRQPEPPTATEIH